MKVLFIGGTGNISSACSELAVSRGIDLYHLNRGKSTEIFNVKGIQTIIADIRDFNQNLIVHCLHRAGAAQDLAGHHSRKTHQTNGGHGINDRHHRSADGLTTDFTHRRGRGLAKQEPLLDDRPLLPDRLGDPFHAQGHAAHGVAQKHAKQGNGILGCVPGLMTDNDKEGQKGDREGRKEHRPGADQS